MKRITTTVIIVLIIGLGAFRLISNKKEIDEKKSIRYSEISPSVNIALVESRLSEQRLNLIGTVSAIKEIEVKSEVQGKVIDLKVELGDFISKGKVLARIDDKMKSLTLTNAEQRYADARQNYERYKNLYEGGAATKAQYDQYKLALESAEVQVSQSKKELSNSVVTAPISGFITQKSVEVGAFASMGSPIVTIVDVSKLKVKLSVPEKDVYSLKVGGPVNITASVYPGVSYEGSITFISQKGDDAHNYPVEVALTNNDQYPLKAGTYVNVHFSKSNNAPTLQIPRDALVGSVKNAKVYVIEGETAKLTPITIGAENGSYLEVMSGLSAKDKVVVTGQINLTDGINVTVIQ